MVLGLLYPKVVEHMLQPLFMGIVLPRHTEIHTAKTEPEEERW